MDDFDAHLPLERASTLPSRWYTDASVYQAESESIVSSGWHCVGPTDWVRELGTYLTATIGAEPIVVSRDLVGRLRAFSNVCRHRATLVMQQPRGKASCFRCRYHGWTYDLNGQLRSAPAFEGVEGFEPKTVCLPRFEVEERGPFVFAALGKSIAPLSSVFSPFLSALDTPDVKALRFYKRTKYSLECNWKVFVDNYLDGGYHVATLHPDLAGVLDESQYQTHLFDWCSVQTSPLVADAKGVAGVRRGEKAQYWWLYPTFMANLYAGAMDTNRVIPTGPETCDVVFDYYFGDEWDEVAREKSMAVAHQVQLEDIEICESVQRGLRSAHYQRGRFSVKEAGAHHFARLLSVARDAVVAGAEGPKQSR